MDSSGVFHKSNVTNKNSPFFDEKVANDTHIRLLTGGKKMQIDNAAEIFRSGSSSEKIEFLSHLYDIFESYSESYGDLTETIELLVEFSVIEDDDEVKEEFINALQTAANNEDISNIDLDNFISGFSKLSQRMMLDVIDIVGFSHNSKYLEFLKQKAGSENSAISNAATMALEEMEAFLQNL
jgi:hypothetical protein